MAQHDIPSLPPSLPPTVLPRINSHHYHVPAETLDGVNDIPSLPLGRVHNCFHLHVSCVF